MIQSCAAHARLFCQQNLTVPQDVYVLLSIYSIWNDLSDPMFDRLELVYFESKACTFLLSYFVQFNLLFFSILWVCCVR